MARRTTRTAAHEPLTVDRVVGHWAFKAVAGALIPLSMWLVSMKLQSIDEAIAEGNKEVRAEVAALREDFAELRDEHKSNTTRLDRQEAEQDRLKLRVDELESAQIRSRHESYERALETWERGQAQWEADRAKKRQRP